MKYIDKQIRERAVVEKFQITTEYCLAHPKGIAWLVNLGGEYYQQSCADFANFFCESDPHRPICAISDRSTQREAP